MAIVQASPGTASITMAAEGKLSELPANRQDVPGGLYPMIARAYEVDEFRMQFGWPVSIPPYDIHATTMVSAAGEVMTSRDDPSAIVTGALVRWVSDPDTLDTNTLKWNPVQQPTSTPMAWSSSVSYMPVAINEYVYRVNDEVFRRPALNFDSDQRNHMWADLTNILGGAAGYTVIMVLSPNSQFGNNTDVPFNGLWSPGGPTPAGDTFAEDVGDSWMTLTMQGGYLWFSTESQPSSSVISISPALNSTAPMMMAVVFDRPEATVYVGPGPSSIRKKTIPSGSVARSMSNSFVLGRTTGDVLHTADMALFDLGVYADRLSSTQVADQFSMLSQVYGGDT